MDSGQIPASVVATDSLLESLGEGGLAASVTPAMIRLRQAKDGLLMNFNNFMGGDF